jgi:hypothetical protein
MPGRKATRFTIALTLAVLSWSSATSASPVAVRHTEGLVHGFLVLSTTEGEPIAYGDLMQFSRSDRVTAHVVLRFKDGSIHDESTVFSQHGNFRLLTYRLEQKGPSFKNPLEMSIDCTSGQVTVRYTHDGKSEVASDHMQLPPDLANGLTTTLLKNLRSGEAPATVSMLVPTPKPRLVQLLITPQGEEPFLIGDNKSAAMHYVIKVQIGGVTGAIAPLLGKEPPDLHIWILGGDAPVFVKSEGPLFAGGPIWRIELTSPVWREPVPERSERRKQ